MTVAERSGVEVDVAVGQLGALGPAGGAGGVEDDRGVVVGALVGLARSGRRPRGLPSTGPIGPHSTILVPLFRGALGRLGHEVGPDEGDLRAGVGEEVVDLAGLEQRVHRHDDAAREEDAPVDDGEGGHVRQDDRHPVTGLDPVGAQRSCHLGGHAVQLGVGDPLAVDPQRVLLRVVRGGRRRGWSRGWSSVAPVGPASVAAGPILSRMPSPRQRIIVRVRGCCLGSTVGWWLR